MYFMKLFIACICKKMLAIFDYDCIAPKQYEAQLFPSLSASSNYGPVHSWTHLCTWHNVSVRKIKRN